MSSFPGQVLTDTTANTYLEQGIWISDTWLDVLERVSKENPWIVHRDDERKINFRQFLSQINSFAAGLLKQGVQPHDRVAIQMNSSLDFLIAWFGAARIGAVSVLLHPDMNKQKLIKILKTTNPVFWLVCDQYHGSSLGRQAGEWLTDSSLPTRLILHHPITPLHDSMLDFHDVFSEEPIYLEQALSITLKSTDPFFILYADNNDEFDPKGIVHLHANTLWAARQYTNWLHIEHGAATLNMSPLYHVTGLLAGVLIPLWTGGKILIHDWFSAKRILQWIEVERPRYIVSTPPHLIHLAESPDLMQFDLSSVERFIYSGEMPMTSAVEHLHHQIGWQAEKLFTINEGLLSCATLPGDALDSVLYSEGFPVPGTEVKLLFNDKERTHAGDHGEMLCISPGFCAGYYNDPDSAQKRWDPSGWFHSGYLFTQDHSGRYYYQGKVEFSDRHQEMFDAEQAD